MLTSRFIEECTVLDLWENQRGGVNNVYIFDLFFDYFFGVNTILEGLRDTREGLNLPHPTSTLKNRTLRTHVSLRIVVI